MIQNLRFGLVDSTENCPLRVLWRSLDDRKSWSQAIHFCQCSDLNRQPIDNTNHNLIWSSTHSIVSFFTRHTSAICEQQFVTGFYPVCVQCCRLVDSVPTLSCSQYSQNICWCRWDDNACLGVKNTCSIGAWPNSLDWRPPWYCKVSPLLQKNKQ